MGPTVLDRLPQTSYSRALSHYCTMRKLLPAVFPPWADTLLLRQPGHPELPQGYHIDTVLSADARSTQVGLQQNPCPQAVHQTQPPSDWITGARHNSQLVDLQLRRYIYLQQFMTSHNFWSNHYCQTGLLANETTAQFDLNILVFSLF